MIRTKLLLAFTGLVFFSLLSWHCTKIDTTNLGGGLIPAVDNVNTFETIINVVANNIDSTVFPGKGCATIYPADDHVLGYIGNDPLFGTTKATIYTELKPAVFPFSFQAKPADRTLDSIVLVLSYKRTYGDTLMPQRVDVQEISGTFNPDSSTCSTYPVKPAILGSATYIPARLADSVKNFGEATKNQLRIRLSNAFGQSLLARDTIKTDSLFKDFLKGFAIIPANIGNALNYFSIADLKTKLAIYYKYKRTSLPDTTVVVNFSLYQGDRSANNIVRNRAGAEVNIVANTNNPAGDNFLYIQTSPGSYAELKIPGLTGLSNRIIHRAELIMEQTSPLSPLDKLFTPPNFLFLDLRDSVNGAYHPLPCDFNFINGQPDIGTYGGFRTIVKSASGDSVARYTFVISRYIQKIITNQRTIPVLRLRAPEFVTTKTGYIDECNLQVPPLLIPLNNVAYGRVKLVGGSTAVNRIRLRLIYSNL